MTENTSIIIESMEEFENKVKSISNKISQIKDLVQRAKNNAQIITETLRDIQQNSKLPE